MYVQLTAAQKKENWEFELREQARPRDIFGLTRGIHRDGESVNTAFMVTKSAEHSNSTTISMLKDLVGEGRYGSQDMLGYEEAQDTFEMRVHADEVKHGVPYEKFGRNAYLKEIYQLIPKINPQIADWHKKKEGHRIRQAYVEGYDYALVGAESQTDIDAGYQYPHSNIFVVGAAFGSQPTFDATIADYSSNVNDAVTAGLAAHPTSLEFLDEISEWASSQKTIGGIEGMWDQAMYIYAMPSRLVTKIYQLLKEVEKFDNGDANLKHLGARRYRNLILVEDQKAARLAVTGTTMTASYWGVNDNRAAAATGTPDVGLLLGKEGMVEYQMEALHYEREVQRYGRAIGIAGFRTNGYNRCDWEEDITNAPLTDNRKNYTSALILSKSNG